MIRIRRWFGLAVSVAALVTLQVVLAQPAAADPIDPCDSFAPDELPDWCLEWSDGPDLPVDDDGDDGGGGGGGDLGESECGWELVTEEFGDGTSLEAIGGRVIDRRPSPDVETAIYSWCGGSPFLLEAVEDAPVVTAEDVAEEAYEAIQGRMPDPVVETSPPAGENAIIDVPVFVTVVNWDDELVETRELGGDTVTVTATPQLLLDSGEPGSAEKTCPGPGQSYDPDGDDLWSQAAAPDACTHAYSARTGVDGRSDEWQTSVTVRWSITWSATSGEGGTFPDAVRSEAVPRGVDEVQAVVTAEGD